MATVSYIFLNIWNTFLRKNLAKATLSAGRMFFWKIFFLIPLSNAWRCASAQLLKWNKEVTIKKSAFLLLTFTIVNVDKIWTWQTLSWIEESESAFMTKGLHCTLNTQCRMQSQSRNQRKITFYCNFSYRGTPIDF